MSTVTFVTAYINCKSNNYFDRIEKTIENFKLLYQCDINIVVYVDNSHADLINQFKNDKIHVIFTELEDLKINKILTDKFPNVNLPSFRSIDKDTKNYLMLINSKTIDFLDHAIEENYFNSTHFAWIDFRIFHVISDIAGAQKYINFISNNKMIDTFLAIAGCPVPLQNTNSFLNDNVNNVYWRFCGGFVVGDINSMKNFCNKSLACLEPFLIKYNTMTWEVNYWAYLEHNGYVKFNWYCADHNDTIIQLPQKYFSETTQFIQNVAALL